MNGLEYAMVYFMIYYVVKYYILSAIGFVIIVYDIRDIYITCISHDQINCILYEIMFGYA